MSESKPVAMWARVGAGLVVSLGAVAILGIAWIYWRERATPNRPWKEWAIVAWSAWLVVPVLFAVAVKGRVPLRRRWPTFPF